MFNPLIFLGFTLYIISLLIGFKIGRRNKDKHNKKYHKFKWPLYGLIYLIFILSTVLLYKAQQVQPALTLALSANVLFILYFSAFTFTQTRCWKQHRMIPYNFFLIPVIYACAIVLENKDLNYLIFLICFYTILEFQFAKFSYKQKLIWD